MAHEYTFLRTGQVRDVRWTNRMSRAQLTGDKLTVSTVRTINTQTHTHNIRSLKNISIQKRNSVNLLFLFYLDN